MIVTAEMAGVETKYINFCGVTSVGWYVWSNVLGRHP